VSKDLKNWLDKTASDVEIPYPELLRLAKAKILNRDLKIEKLEKRNAELEKENKTLRSVLPKYITESDIDKMRDEALTDKE
jgi:cell division protein FtsB